MNALKMNPGHRPEPGPLRILMAALLVAVGLTGQTGFQWLRSSSHPRAMALSGAHVAAVDPAEAVNLNPAGLLTAHPVTSRSVLAGYRSYPAGIGETQTQLRLNRERYAFALDVRRMNYGDFSEYDENRVHMGSYSASETAFRAGIARRQSKLVSLGVTLGYVQGQLAGHRSGGLLWGAGAQLNMPALSARAGVTLQNLGRYTQTYSPDADTEQLPTFWLVGLSKSLVHLPFTLHLAAGAESNTGRKLLRLGGEFQLPGAFQLRFGLDQRKSDLHMNRTYRDILSGFSLGIGRTVSAGSPAAGRRRLSLDGSMQLLGPLGYTSAFAMGWQF